MAHRQCRAGGSASCSAEYSDGSPEHSRATSCPARCARTSCSVIWSRSSRWRVDQFGAGRAMRENVGGDVGPGVQADRRCIQQPHRPDGQQVGRARTGADEMHRHSRIRRRGLIMLHWATGPGRGPAAERSERLHPLDRHPDQLPAQPSVPAAEQFLGLQGDPVHHDPAAGQSMPASSSPARRQRWRRRRRRPRAAAAGRPRPSRRRAGEHRAPGTPSRVALRAIRAARSGPFDGDGPAAGVGPGPFDGHRSGAGADVPEQSGRAPGPAGPVRTRGGRVWSAARRARRRRRGGPPTVGSRHGDRLGRRTARRSGSAAGMRWPGTRRRSRPAGPPWNVPRSPSTVIVLGP